MKKYEQIATEIERKIISGEYKDFLPKQIELAKEYDTSRVTISRAFNLLKDREIIDPIKGHWTKIKSKNISKLLIDSDANKTNGFTNHSLGGGIVTSHIIAFDQRMPTDEECQVLRLAKDDLVYDIIRQRLLNGIPAKLEYTIMPVKVIPGITDDILHKSIYGYIKEHLHLNFGKANRIITAEKPDAYDIKYLDCSKDDPVLCVRQIKFLDDNTPFEYSETRNKYNYGSLMIYDSTRGAS
ncbi:GntR family transcriptional regulator [Lactobacillus jensenii]|uniref:GntR family transcriptional regulator n=2 Tax=Lactobacillus jensenii TaxID=109790 RepID=UPI001F23DF02|nr:GntR family transcriptional regulator [Lactobacillus jensenii]MCF1852110.1 GntR family transcriptional regulator [Lactobacillus jensenii]